ncbi:uncharacterized protein LOC131950439 [Physella acuta]|uniref:uncharacterized protein LOC131950439 n=1 Tax=Physella acuta TaxID=109671 RepID=UPI0027DC35B4|nr:uncharacterized protein LOC131950439 [Physella acuta]
MALITVALAFLGVWSISAQDLHKSIAPKQILKGGEVTVFCDADLAAVPQESTIRGISALTLRWKGYTYEAEYTVQGGFRYKLKRHWRLRHYGADYKNGNGYFDSHKFRMELDIVNVKPDDEGQFCCDSVFVRQKDAENSSVCENVTVSHRAIVHNQGEYTIITCDSTLAGVPEKATELKNVSLFWQNKEVDRNSYLLYEITIDPNNKEKPRVNLIKPRGKDHWQALSYSKNLTSNMRIKKYEASVGVVITRSIHQDSGWFCCSSTYFAMSDTTRESRSCHYFAGFRGDAHTTSGSSNKTVTGSLIFVLMSFLICSANLLYG